MEPQQPSQNEPAAEQPSVLNTTEEAIPAPQPDITPAPETGTVPEPQTAETDASSAEAESAAPSDSNAEQPAEEPVEKPAEEPKTDEKKTDEEEPYTFRQFVKDALDLMESVVTAVFFVVLIFTYICCTATVDGDSMLPTLENHEQLLVSRTDHTFETGDILILNSNQSYMFNEDGELYSAPGLGKRIVKRLIAQGGQEINIDFDAGIVYVDGNALDEPYTSTLTTRNNHAFTYPFTVPEGYIFVLGDNRYISNDSRHPDVGLIPERDIVGRVMIRLLPFSKFGKIE